MFASRLTITLLTCLLLSACGKAPAPTAEALTQALNNKLQDDLKKLETRAKNMGYGLERRSLNESIDMQRAQQLSVSRINTCSSEENSEQYPEQYRCNVFLNISMKGLEGSKERNVILAVSPKDDHWVLDHMSLPPR